MTKDYRSVQYTGEDYDDNDDEVHFVLFNCRHEDSRNDGSSGIIGDNDDADNVIIIITIIIFFFAH